MVCVLGTSSFAVTYNELTADQFVWAWIKSEQLIPREIKFECNNVYWEAIIPYINKKEREVLKRDKKLSNLTKQDKGQWKDRNYTPKQEI